MAKFILVIETDDDNPTMVDEHTSVQDALAVIGRDVSNIGLVQYPDGSGTLDTEHNVRNANGNTRGYWMVASGRNPHAILSMVKSVVAA